MPTGAYDPVTGIWEYGEDDLLSPWSTYMNKGMTSVKNAMTVQYHRGVWGLSAAQVLTSGNFVVLAAATASGTPSGMSNTGGAVTVTNAGLYEVTTTVVWQGGTGYRRYLGVTKNCASINAGGTLIAGELVTACLDAPAGGSSASVQTFRSQRISCAAGDVIRVFAFQDSPGNLNIEVGSTATYLGPTRLAVARQI